MWPHASVLIVCVPVCSEKRAAADVIAARFGDVAATAAAPAPGSAIAGQRQFRLHVARLLAQPSARPVRLQHEFLQRPPVGAPLAKRARAGVVQRSGERGGGGGGAMVVSNNNREPKSVIFLPAGLPMAAGARPRGAYRSVSGARRHRRRPAAAGFARPEDPGCGRRRQGQVQAQTEGPQAHHRKGAPTAGEGAQGAREDATQEREEGRKNGRCQRQKDEVNALREGERE